MLTPSVLSPRLLSPSTVDMRLEGIDSNFRTFLKAAPWIRPLAAAEAAHYLGQAVHDLNVNSGWWHALSGATVKLDRPFGELLALTSSELTEAWEAWQDQSRDDKLPLRRGEEVELADTLIRIFDWIGAGQIPIELTISVMTENDRDIIAGPRHRTTQYLACHGWIGKLLERSRKTITYIDKDMAYSASMLIYQVAGLAFASGYDLEGAFIDKLTFNHIPANRVIDGGKKI